MNYYYKYDIIINMVVEVDEICRNKFRAVGAIAVLVIAIFGIFFLFYQQREKKNTAMKLRLFFSDMTQTMQYSMNINGPPGEWGLHGGYKNVDSLNNYLVNYLRISENCINQSGKCFTDINYKNLKKQDTDVNLSKLPSVRLNNGISLAFETISSCKTKDKICVLVYSDLNGEKPPNIFGKDLFVFTIINSQAAAFMPYNLSISPEDLSKDETYGCNKSAKIPMYCSGLLYTKNWSIDSKYPW